MQTTLPASAPRGRHDDDDAPMMTPSSSSSVQRKRQRRRCNADALLERLSQAMTAMTSMRDKNVSNDSACKHDNNDNNDNNNDNNNKGDDKTCSGDDDDKSTSVRTRVAATMLARTHARMSALSSQLPLHFVGNCVVSLLRPPPSSSTPPSSSLLPSPPQLQVCVSATSVVVGDVHWRRLDAQVLCRVFARSHTDSDAQTATTASLPSSSSSSAVRPCHAHSHASAQLIFCFIDDVLLTPVAAPMTTTTTTDSHDDNNDNNNDNDNSDEATPLWTSVMHDARAPTSCAAAVLSALASYAQRGYHVVLIDHYPALHHGNAVALCRALQPVAALCRAHLSHALPRLTVALSVVSNVLPPPPPPPPSVPTTSTPRARTRRERVSTTPVDVDVDDDECGSESSRVSTTTTTASVATSTTAARSGRARRQRVASSSTSSASGVAHTTSLSPLALPHAGLVTFVAHELNASLMPDVATSFVVGTRDRHGAFCRDVHRRFATRAGLRYVDVHDLLAEAAAAAHATR